MVRSTVPLALCHWPRGPPILPLVIRTTNVCLVIEARRVMARQTHLEVAKDDLELAHQAEMWHEHPELVNGRAFSLAAKPAQEPAQ